MRPPSMDGPDTSDAVAIACTAGAGAGGAVASSEGAGAASTDSAAATSGGKATPKEEASAGNWTFLDTTAYSYSAVTVQRRPTQLTQPQLVRAEPATAWSVPRGCPASCTAARLPAEDVPGGPGSTPWKFVNDSVYTYSPRTTACSSATSLRSPGSGPSTASEASDALLTRSASSDSLEDRLLTGGLLKGSSTERSIRGDASEVVLEEVQVRPGVSPCETRMKDSELVDNIRRSCQRWTRWKQDESDDWRVFDTEMTPPLGKAHGGMAIGCAQDREATSRLAWLACVQCHYRS